MSVPEMDDRYTKKDWFQCEKCLHTNILNIVKAPKRKKTQHNIFCDAPTWTLFTSLAAQFDFNNGRMLAFLVGRLQKEQEQYDTAV